MFSKSGDRERERERDGKTCSEMSYSWWARSLLPPFWISPPPFLNSLAQCRPRRAWVVDWLLIPSVDELCSSLNCALGCINTDFIILWQSNNICPHRKAFWAFSARERRQRELLVRSSQDLDERQRDCCINGVVCVRWCDAMPFFDLFTVCILFFRPGKCELKVTHLCSQTRQDKKHNADVKDRFFIFWGGTRAFVRKQQKRHDAGGHCHRWLVM